MAGGFFCLYKIHNVQMACCYGEANKSGPGATQEGAKPVKGGAGSTILKKEKRYGKNRG
jgi:hypothetical protein